MPSVIAEGGPVLFFHHKDPTLDARPLQFPDRMRRVIVAERFEGRLGRRVELVQGTYADRDGRGDGPAPIAAVDKLPLLVHDRGVAVTPRDNRQIFAEQL